MYFAIDKGHNLPVNRGASGIEQEDDLTFELGNILIEELKKSGHQVIDCTPDKAETISDALSQRVEKANQAKVDYFVSIHFNAFDGTAHGAEVFHYPGSTRARDLADRVLAELTAIGFRNRGVKSRDSLYVLKKTTMPAILIEVCFCDSVKDMEHYRKKGAEEIARRIARGLASAPKP
ncbi:MAG: N-acetylmuramoyl-L-alanine amidase [Candidatus Obscuribacterales bacterium]